MITLRCTYCRMVWDEARGGLEGGFPNEHAVICPRCDNLGIMIKVETEETRGNES